MIDEMTHAFHLTRLRFLIGALMVLAASAQFRPALAEEANASVQPDPASKSAESSHPDAALPEQPAAKGAKTPEEFTPSEEISEDFAVSFPVDI